MTIATNFAKKYTLLYKPNCSKCIGSLNLLMKELDLGDQLTTINYLEIPPKKEELEYILSVLDPSIDKSKLLRDIELKDQKIDDDFIVSTILKSPINMQRPIFVNNELKKAVIGRPVELIKNAL